MWHFPFIGIIFWAGVFTWLSIVAWSRYLREQERQKTLRIFAERGQALDSETLEKLLPRTARANSSDSPENMARGLMIGGVVTMFSALGLAAGAQIIGRIDADALWGMSGAAAIAGFVGLGLLVASLIVRSHARAEKKALLDPADGSR